VIRALAALVVALALVACQETAPPRPQALVFVDTDLASPGLADRVRIEVLARTDGAWTPACDGCSREVAIASAADWPLSFGVEAPEDGSPLRVHATLFPAGRISAGRALPETAIDGVFELSFGDAVMPQEVFLEGACAGIAGTDESSCVGGALAPIRVAPERDPAAPSRVGSFRRDEERPCDGPPAEDSGLFDEEVCVPGATYWMGDVRRQGFGAHFDAVPEHLVTVSSFFLDRYEYTVGRYRDALERGFVPTGAPPGTVSTNPKCTLPDDEEDDSRDAFPLNCVHPYLAEELCGLDGRRLPTEAEFEWAAGNGPDERLFPWGELRTAETTLMDGPTPVGERDYDEASGISDLGWNVVEWMADDFQTYTERCWLPGNYGVSPLCLSTPDDLLHGRSARGGYWMEAGDRGASYRPMAPNRQVYPQGVSPLLGFRCARDG
jgi:formylglycine-generating enzyme required for sulfatase activity